MITFRDERIQISDIDSDFEIGIRVTDDNVDLNQEQFINESQAKQIVEHFKEQFGWDK